MIKRAGLDCTLELRQEGWTQFAGMQSEAEALLTEVSADGCRAREDHWLGELAQKSPSAIQVEKCVDRAIVSAPVNRPRHSIPHTARALATSVAKSSSLEKTAMIPEDKASFSILTL